MSWSTLSEDIWTQVLLHVPLSHRLESCSRVSRTLYRAAAAATEHIELGDGSVQRLPGLCHWALHHGQHLTSVRLGPCGASCYRHSGPGLTQLPCPNLRELDLHDMKVQLDISSTHPGVLHSCTRLTKLLMKHCTLVDGQSGLTAVSALVRLQHLELTMSMLGDGTASSQSQRFKASRVLQHLTQLTHLCLQCVSEQHTFPMEHISCLANLQELNILNSHVLISSSTTPGLSKLTALQKIHLQAVSFSPSSLCHVQQLQSLQLDDLHEDLPVAAEAAAYSSLTASSHLQQLSIHIDNLPEGVWQHAFPPSCQLPLLRKLSVFCYDRYAFDPPEAALQTDDLSSIISCCPGLHTIRVGVQPGAQLAVLAKASGLTSLAVAFVTAEGLQSLSALSGLVSLQELSVDLGGPITPQDLLCLTALTGLTELCVDADTAPEWDGAEDVDILLTQECHTGMPSDPPVWLQLLQHCGQFSECP